MSATTTQPDLETRALTALIDAMDAGMDLKSAAALVAWDSLQEAKALGWSAKLQQAVVDFVCEVAADLATEANKALA